MSADAPPAAPAVRLVAFDLDGTLLRGDTVCEGIARHLGRHERMRELERAQTVAEITAAREEMAGWYAAAPGPLLDCLPTLQLAPGTLEGFALLRARGIATALVSITWEFAVAWFARQLGATYHVGTRLHASGAIGHFWPADKAIWLDDLRLRLGLRRDEVAAIGDSAGDIPLLRAAGRAYFVGPVLPDGLVAQHLPDGDIAQIVRQLFDPR